MTKILIKQDNYGVLSVYADCPNVEVQVQHVDGLEGLKLKFKDGVFVEDFAATQYKVLDFDF